MIHKMFSVYDSKAEAFLPPFICPTEGVARRAFDSAAMDPSHQFAISPSDYTLFEIGLFNDENGEVDPYNKFVNHGFPRLVRKADQAETIVPGEA